MFALKKHILVLYLLLGAFLFLSGNFVYANNVSCGGDCTGSQAVCIGGTKCHTGLCCKTYNTCTGGLCSANGAWGCSSGDSCAAGVTTCNYAGTTRSPATWSDFGVCSASCGVGTHVRTCTCGNENDCALTCSSPTTNCDATESPAPSCCKDSAPIKPSSVTATQNSTDANQPTRVDVGWSFGAGATGCGNEWGYACGGQADTFSIKVDNIDNVTLLGSALRTATITVGSWGSHSYEVCASNGYTTTCSDPVTSTPLALIEPDCTVSGQSPTSGCYATFPSLSATIGNGADQIQYVVSDAINPWICNSGWITGNYTSGCDGNIASGTFGDYNWAAHAQSNPANPIEKCITSALNPSYVVKIDKKAPPEPIPTLEPVVDGSCLGKYFVKYSWKGVVDEGCGNTSVQYRSQATDLVGGLSIPTQWVNGAAPNLPGYVNLFPSDVWGGLLTQTTQLSYVPGKVIYTHVKSEDALGNKATNFTGPETYIIPSPTPYPPIHVTGPIAEEIGGTCDVMKITGAVTWNPTFSNATGVTASCSIPGPNYNTYACDITIDNHSGVCYPLTTDMTMSAPYAGYDPGIWKSSCPSATPASVHIDVNGAAPSGPTLFFKYSDTAAGWFKSKDTSFNSRTLGNRDNIVPYNVKSIDNNGDDRDLGHSILSGNSGLLLQNGVINPGPNASVDGKPVYSQNKWYTSVYSSTSDMSADTYFDYIRVRKEFTTIDSLAKITTDGIYRIEGNVDISNPAEFNGKNVVLDVKGTATFKSYIDGGATVKTFIPSAGSIAVVANAIAIDSDITEIHAILIGKTVATGESSTGLKIKGNLVDEDTNSLEIKRTQNDPHYPSLFVQFDPQAYLNLLPYLSTSTYDWRQIQ